MNAQTSVEFLVIFILFVAIALVFAISSYWRTYQVTEYNQQRGAETVLWELGNKINTVYLEQDGFATNITVPTYIEGRNYSIQVSNNYLIINISGIHYTRLLITNVSGTLSKGVNTVKNIGGYVTIA